MVYPIPSIIFFPSKKKQCSCYLFFLLFIIIITMVYIYRNASKFYITEFTRSVRTFEMHQYLFICIIYWKNKQQCNQLQYKQQCPTSLNMKSCSAEQKLHDKKGSRVKKSHCKKLQQICNEKRFTCEWDH